MKPLTAFQRMVLSRLSSIGGLVASDIAGNAQAPNVRRTLVILRARGLAESFVFEGATYWRLPAREITAAECAADPGLGRLGG